MRALLRLTASEATCKSLRRSVELVLMLASCGATRESVVKLITCEARCRCIVDARGRV